MVNGRRPLHARQQAARPEDRASRHDSLREQMYVHFKDAIKGEHDRLENHQPLRYPVRFQNRIG